MHNLEQSETRENNERNNCKAAHGTNLADCSLADVKLSLARREDPMTTTLQVIGDASSAKTARTESTSQKPGEDAKPAASAPELTGLTAKANLDLMRATTPEQKQAALAEFRAGIKETDDTFRRVDGQVIDAAEAKVPGFKEAHSQWQKSVDKIHDLTEKMGHEELDKVEPLIEKWASSKDEAAKDAARQEIQKINPAFAAALKNMNDVQARFADVFDKAEGVEGDVAKQYGRQDKEAQAARVGSRDAYARALQLEGNNAEAQKYFDEAQRIQRSGGAMFN